MSATFEGWKPQTFDSAGEHRKVIRRKYAEGEEHAEDAGKQAAANAKTPRASFRIFVYTYAYLLLNARI